MKRFSKLTGAAWPMALGMTLLSAGASAQDGPPPRDPRPPHDAPAPPEGPPGAHRERIIIHHKAHGPGAQFGMAVTPLPKPLDVQLKLNGEGALVAHVRPGSAADKAGVKDHDVVITIDEAPVKDPRDLAKAVEDAPEQERTLTLLRAGEKVTVKMAPEKLPAGRDVEVHDESRFHLDGDELRIDVGELRDLERTIRDKLRNAGVDMRMQFIEPGAFLPRGADFSFGRRTSLPEDMSVTIRKQGKQPADVEVKKGDQTWNVKEDDLAPLPDEVRAAVEGYLGHTPMRFRVVGPGGDEHGFGFGGPHPPGDEGRGPRPPRGHERPDGVRPPRGPEGPVGPPEGPGDERFGPEARGRDGGGLERRLEEMARRMEEMQRQLEGLRHNLREGGDERPRTRRPDRPQPPEDSDRPAEIDDHI